MQNNTKYYAGIDLGGTNISTGIVDENGNIVSKASLKTNSGRPSEEIVSDMLETVRMACENGNIDFESVQSIGIGSPGAINSKDGVVIYSPNLNWKDVKVFELMSKVVNKPLYIANDANCGAFGEFIAGGAKGSESAVIITIGTGIGSGIICDGKILEGFNGAAGELGHTLLIKDGVQCACGRKGCWEAYSSATALIRQTKEMLEKDPKSIMHKFVEENGKISGKTAFLAAKQGDKAGKEVVNNYLLYLADGIVNVINTFQPEMVLIGGGVSHEGDYILDVIREHVKKYSYGANFLTNTRIERAILGNDAGIIGAAMLYKIEK